MRKRKYNRKSKALLAKQKTGSLKLFQKSDLSLYEISRRTGASMGNVRYWYKQAFPCSKDNIKKAVYKKYLSGRYTGTEIAKMYNLKPRTVQRWIRGKFGIENLRRKYCLRMNKNGFSKIEISAILDIEQQTVNKFLREKDSPTVLKT